MAVRFAQLIQAGAANLMTAGRGIVHSERASDDIAVTSRLHGIQSWLALPLDREEMEPGFVHYPATALPEIARDGARRYPADAVDETVAFLRWLLDLNFVFLGNPGTGTWFRDTFYAV